MRRIGLLVTVAVVTGVGAGRGQAIAFSQKPRGEAGVEAAGLWVGFPQQPGLRRFDSWQWIDARIGGAVWDPRLLRFRVGLRPQWRQAALAGLPEPTDQRATWWGWDAGIELLPNSAVNASLSTVRSSNTLRAGFGTETRQRLTGFNARVGFRNPYFPLELQYRARNQDEYWWTGPRDWRGQQLSQDVLRFVAQNRKTALTVERNWISDRTAGTDYVLDRDELRHSAGWGKGSRLSSRLGYLEQTGARAYRVVSWTEGAHLQHTRRIGTDYRFDLGAQQVAGSPVHNRLLDGSFTYQIAAGLRAVAGGTSRFIGYGGGREDRRQLRSRVDYRATWSPGVRLSAGLSLGYEWHGLEPVGDDWVAVVDEQHVLDAGGRFTLNNPQIDLTSVMVSSADRTLVYEAGLDYQQLEGLPSVEIVVLPGGRIAIGDTLLVSYRYQPFPTFRASGVTGGYDASLKVRGFDVYHRRTLRDVGDAGGSPTAGPTDVRLASWLGDYHEMVLGARFSGGRPVGSLDIGAERIERRINTSYRATVSQLRGSLTAKLHPAVRASVAGSASWTSTETIDRLTMTSGSSSVTWSPISALSLQGTLALWQWTQDPARNSRFVGGDVVVLWNPGLLRIDLRYSRNAWRDGAERTDDRLSVRLARAF